MLLPTMNHNEVAKEFFRDLQIIKATTLKRLHAEYDCERRKFKINTAKAYPKFYSIKTKAKNNWLICICKSPSAEKYKGTNDSCYCCITYYYDRAGLVALRHFEEMNIIEAFWGHLFERYNERMNLNLPTVVDMIKAFFGNSGYLHHLIYPSPKGKRSFSICADGFVFGEMQHDDTWLVNKTFVSKELASERQTLAQESMISQLEEEALMKFASKNFDAIAYEKTNNVVLQLKRA